MVLCLGILISQFLDSSSNTVFSLSSAPQSVSHAQNFALLICSKHPACQSSSESSAYGLPRLPCSSDSGPIACPDFMPSTVSAPLPSGCCFTSLFPLTLPTSSSIHTHLTSEQTVIVVVVRTRAIAHPLPFGASLRPAWLLVFACGGAVT